MRLRTKTKTSWLTISWSCSMFEGAFPLAIWKGEGGENEEKAELWDEIHRQLKPTLVKYHKCSWFRHHPISGSFLSGLLEREETTSFLKCHCWFSSVFASTKYNPRNIFSRRYYNVSELREKSSSTWHLHFCFLSNLGLHFFVENSYFKVPIHSLLSK